MPDATSHPARHSLESYLCPHDNQARYLGDHGNQEKGSVPSVIDPFQHPFLGKHNPGFHNHVLMPPRPIPEIRVEFVVAILYCKLEVEFKIAD